MHCETASEAAIAETGHFHETSITCIGIKNEKKTAWVKEMLNLEFKPSTLIMKIENIVRARIERPGYGFLASNIDKYLISLLDERQCMFVEKIFPFKLAIPIPSNVTAK
ncbi:hypothetical protein GOBAR_DD22565 [Gossypium barbadense]|nr:hypothetical protein GOBAR_DD22565 [Gossypium barbadense]